MDNTASTAAFWLWWVLTLGLGIWQILRAWRQPRELLGFATVATVLWLYIYCYLPYHLIAVARAAFPVGIWNLAQFTAFIALASLLAGWHWKLSPPRRSISPVPE